MGISEQKVRWLCPKCETQDLYSKKDLAMAEFRSGCKRCSESGCLICTNPTVLKSQFCKDHVKTHDKNYVVKPK